MHASRMHDGGIDRYPAISTSPYIGPKRSKASPETAARAPTRMPILRERRRSARLPPRPDAERYVHTVRDLTFPIGDVAVGIGSPLVSRREPKRSFLTPRGAFGCGAANAAMFTGGRIRDPMPSGPPLRPPSRTPCEVGPNHRSASAVPAFSPSGQGVKMCRGAPYNSYSYIHVHQTSTVVHP